MSFMIYEDSETILEKTNDCKKNLKHITWQKLANIKLMVFLSLLNLLTMKLKTSNFFDWGPD